MTRTTKYSTLARHKSSAPIFDRYIIVPISACLYAVVASPLILSLCNPLDPKCVLESRPENKIFWPSMALISVIFALQNRSRVGRLSLPPHIVCFLAYLAFAGASVAWAYKPELSFIRFAQQVMIVISIVLPALLATRTADMMLGLFICFACASVLNVLFILGGPPILPKGATWGHTGYFLGKNSLGQCASIALLLSFHEMLYSGRRRAAGIIFALIAASVLFLSNSKTSIGLALLVPCLAAVALFPGFMFPGKRMRISPAIILLIIPACYILLSNVSGFNMHRVSYIIYGDSTFTGRTFIWDFVNSEIARRPLLGWGYQSFWLVGPDGPSFLHARGWIKSMPHAHSGYLDTMLELGYVGFALLLIFIIATLHATGRMAEHEPARAWLVLSLVLFVIVTNFLESTWMRSFDFLWVVYLIAVAEIARHWQPSPPGGRARHGHRSSEALRLGPQAAFNRPATRSTSSKIALAADERPNSA